MLARHRRLVGTAASLFLLVGALAAPATTSANSIVHQTDLTGAAEVPGPGDPDATGFAEISADPANGSICWTIIVEGMDQATAAHVHVGAEGVAGGVVVALGTPDVDGFTQDCSSGHDSAVLQAIVDDPTGHYVNVHNDAFPDGAVRGQLSEAIELSDVTVAVFACPEGIDSPDDIDLEGFYDTCAPVGRFGDFDGLPDGYAWSNGPIEMDLEVELEEPDGFVQGLADSVSSGGSGTCNPTTLTCVATSGYLWERVLAGDTTVTQIGEPDGYDFGWAVLASTSTNGIAPTLVDVSGSSVTFDTTGIDQGAYVALVNVVAAAEPPPPTGTQAPVVTPPPTSTIDDASSAGSIGPAFAAVALFGLVAVALGYRRRLTR